MAGVAVVLAVGYVVIYLFDKLKSFWEVPPKEETDCSAEGTTDHNFILRTGKIFSVFYQLGLDLLKEVRATNTELREVKSELKELRDFEISRLVILRAILAEQRAIPDELKKLEESTKMTEKVLVRELKSLTVCLVVGSVGWSGSNPCFGDGSNP